MQYYSPKVIQVIENTITRGDGKSNENPFRSITQYIDFNGNILAETNDLYDIITTSKNKVCNNKCMFYKHNVEERSTEDRKICESCSRFYIDKFMERKD